MTTRAQKRRIGVRDVWDLIVNNDDVSFKHILPRLNGTDVKFLYGVNSETRKLIKRSSRKGELKKRFRVSEMSSISTLEVAWEKSLWPIWWNETWFCFQVAKTNKLELLKWIREEKQCEWNSRTIDMAANQGNLEMVKYCVANECPINERACACAAENGHLEVLKYLREEAKAPWDSRTASWAAGSGHLHILEYLVERKYDEYDEEACWEAAENGHLDCLKYLHETAKAPWNSRGVYYAHKNNQPECVQYLLDNNCPLPRGWRYEDGELYSDSDSDSEQNQNQKQKQKQSNHFYADGCFRKTKRDKNEFLITDETLNSHGRGMPQRKRDYARQNRRRKRRTHMRRQLDDASTFLSLQNHAYENSCVKQAHIYAYLRHSIVRFVP